MTNYNLWSGRRQQWWRTNGLGYTDNRAEAGRFDEEQAVSHVLRSARGGDPKLVTCMVLALDELEPISASVTLTGPGKHSAVEEAIATATEQQRYLVNHATGGRIAIDGDTPTVEHQVVWQCTKCDTLLAGNPRYCTCCGYTVYRPLYPEVTS